MADAFRLSAPWYTYAREVRALFEYDEDVRVLYDEDDGPKVRVLVRGDAKAEAIAWLLPESVDFGGVTLHNVVVPANGEASTEQMVRDAFAGNAAVDSIVTALEGTPLAGTVYVCFAPEAVQFFNDDVSDPAGVETKLFEDVARDVAKGHDGLMFTSEDHGATIWP